MLLQLPPMPRRTAGALTDETSGLCADRGQTVLREYLGASWEFPEENCCACGKGVPSLDTRLWDDCDPRWSPPKRGCPGFSPWEQASAHYIGQSHEMRSQSQGNPCIAHGDDATACAADVNCHWDADQAGGRLGTDKHDPHHCKLNESVPDYAEGHRLEVARLASSQDARCLDGSAPLYFLKKGSGSGADKWYVHHEGGGWCVGLEECGLRAKAAGEAQKLTKDGPKIYTNLGSTEQFVDSGTLNAANGGYFSSDRTVNPMMWNWNMVYIKYCDGGSFAGNLEQPIKTPNGTTVRCLPCCRLCPAVAGPVLLLLELDSDDTSTTTSSLPGLDPPGQSQGGQSELIQRLQSVSLAAPWSLAERVCVTSFIHAGLVQGQGNSRGRSGRPA